MSQHKPTRFALFIQFAVADQANTQLIPAFVPDRAASVHRQLIERTVEGIPFDGIFWNTAVVLSEILDLAKQKNLIIKLLETLSDCDTPEDMTRSPRCIG